MTGWLDGYWWSSDDVHLHYRDYPGRSDRPAILCIPGLTRNARDFAVAAERLAGEWRVICVDLRGRELGEALPGRGRLLVIVERFVDRTDVVENHSFCSALADCAVAPGASRPNAIR